LDHNNRFRDKYDTDMQNFAEPPLALKQATPLPARLMGKKIAP